MEIRNQRNYRIDNIKAVLIFLVVFGHMLELIAAKQIYLIIYSFHMPAFIFVTGYYAKFRPRKILLELMMPYILFQTLYLIFEGYTTGESTTFQYMRPYWLLWYLLTVIIYYILLPMIKTDRMKQRGQIVALSFAISLLAGYDSTVGYYMSLSRTMVFLPFFVMGHYAGNSETKFDVLKKWYHKIAILIGVLLSSYYIITAQVSSVILYGSYSYEATESGVFQRAVLLIIAFIWILALFRFVPDIKIPILSDLGKGTFSVFLVHGFI
ncbi:MAG: acyltransferase family protein, partial [Lachnospiraceae bacterium]|nr:acyltransferase family protein [Lachnospiraceae bacterium]